MRIDEEKNRKNRKKNTPNMSDPVISRSGRIGRKNVDDVIGVSSGAKTRKSRTKDPKSAKLIAQGEVAKKDVAISDGEFLKSDEKKTKRKRGIHTVKSREKNPFPFVTVIACVICTLLFMSLVINLVRINEYTKDVSDMRESVTRLQKERSELSADLETKNSVEKLQTYISSMGMVKERDMNPPVPVKTAKPEKIDDFEATEESETVITTVLNALAKSFGDVIGIFGGNN